MASDLQRAYASQLSSRSSNFLPCVVRHVYGHVYRHRHVYRHVCRHVYEDVYEHVYRYVHCQATGSSAAPVYGHNTHAYRHVYRHVYRHMHRQQTCVCVVAPQVTVMDL